MNEREQARKTNRREILKLSGLGIVGGAAVSSLAVEQAKAIVPGYAISYASWIHGHSLAVEAPEKLVSQWRAGFGLVIDGQMGTENWLHFAIPTPVILNDVRLQVDSIMLRFTTGSADAYVRDVYVYDGERPIASFTGITNGAPQQFDPILRLPLDSKPYMGYGLGISIGVTFGIQAMSHQMWFSSAGCDFIAQPVAL